MELFLVFLILIGIVIASIQDLRKKEVENWINFFILISSLAFIVFRAIHSLDIDYLFLGLFCLYVCVILGQLFYSGKVFAGGDAKLFMALFALFIASDINGCLYNLLLFCLFLMFSGAVYGLMCILFLYVRDFSKVNKHFKIEIKNKYLKYTFLLGVLLLIFSFFNELFLYLSFFIMLACILFAFSRSIEKVSMVKEIKASELREGDWLAQAVKVKGKVISYNWEGLTLKQIKLLKNLKSKIKIKEGIAFVPAFLIAFIIYIFKERIIQFILVLL